MPSNTIVQVYNQLIGSGTQSDARFDWSEFDAQRSGDRPCLRRSRRAISDVRPAAPPIRPA